MKKRRVEKKTLWLVRLIAGVPVVVIGAIFMTQFVEFYRSIGDVYTGSGSRHANDTFDALTASADEFSQQSTGLLWLLALGVGLAFAGGMFVIVYKMFTREPGGKRASDRAIEEAIAAAKAEEAEAGGGPVKVVRHGESLHEVLPSKAGGGSA